jgi:hypothetical protein
LYSPIYSKDIKEIYNNLKASSKKRRIEFTLTLTDLNDLTFPITCPILGIPLRYNKGQVRDDSISIDRIDNSKGYIPGNLIVISYKANRLKNNASKEELIRISEFYETL